MGKKLLGLRVLFTNGLLPYTITAGAAANFNHCLTRKMGFYEKKQVPRITYFRFANTKKFWFERK